MRVLITGAGGQLGRELLRTVPAGITVTALGSAECDVGDPGSVSRAIGRHGPETIINAAGYTAVDKAESEPALADRVNALGPGHLAAAAGNARLLHVSTDFVFDGEQGRPWRAEDRTNPLSAYGRSKLAGESPVLALGNRGAVLRTSWVYSRFGGNFVKTMLRLGKERPEMRVVADQHGAPTFAADLADAAVALLPRLAAAPAGDSVFGVTHLTGAPYTTWHGFAQAIFAAAARRGQPAPKLTAIGTADYPTPARRPANSRLDCSRAATVLGIPPRDWREGLERCLDQLMKETAA